jgi:hypothetical protein
VSPRAGDRMNDERAHVGQQHGDLLLIVHGDQRK